MATQVVMPKLGESVTEGTVGKWLKQKGDQVAVYEPLVEVITDKVNSEIPSPADGILLEILVPEGETVKTGVAIAVVGAPGEAVSAPPPRPLVEKAQTPLPRMPVETVTAPPAPPPQATAPRSAYLSPVVARLVAEHGIDVSRIQGSGEGGRVTRQDVEKYLARLKEAPAPVEAAFAPAVSPTKPPPPAVSLPEPPAVSLTKPPAGMAEEELLPLTPIRRAIAEHMVRSVHTSPHVTTVFEVDMHKIAAHRNASKETFARQGADLTYTAYFVEFVARVLREQPAVNSTFTDKGLLLKKAINIGVAVALEDGLIVPVLKNADELNLLGVAKGVNDLARRAREKRLNPDDVQGGTFTVTNPGAGGSLFGTPIINQPQVAIMGVGAIVKRAVVIDDAIAIRPMVYLSLTFDHRALDGADGDRFLSAVKRYLESYA